MSKELTSMPYKIKNKLKQLAKACEKARKLEIEADNMITEYGVNTDYLNAMNVDDVCTEAMAFITNAEGGTPDSIDEIEKVFVYHYNKNLKERGEI